MSDSPSRAKRMNRDESVARVAARSILIVGALLALSTADVGAVEALYTGAGSCSAANCHGSRTRRDYSDVAGQDEYLIWSGERRLKASYGEDLHRRAYDALLTDRGLEVARRLGMVGPRAAAESWVQEAVQPGRCLSCHSMHDPAAAPGSIVVPSDGVSCEACHGPAGRWKGSHFRGGSSYGDSVEAGMVATRDPAVGGAVCFDCHVGSASQRVDHEMLAAGHPPLVFELDTFATFAPHWSKHADNAAWYGGVPWIIGQVLALRAATELAAYQIRSHAWPDFAAYDCYSCHHHLATERTWRQGRPRGVPGLPPWDPSRYLVLSRLAHVLAKEHAARLDAAVDRLAKLIRDGRSGPETSMACDDVVRAADDVLAQLPRTPLDEKSIARLVHSLSRDGTEVAYGGFHAAQQVAWGLDSLMAAGSTTGTALDRTLPAIRHLLEELKDPAAYEPARFAHDLANVARDVP